MYSFDDLAEHLKTAHNLPVASNQMQDLRNIGYYHGYKGYRFIRNANNKIDFTAFGQVVALNNFDMQLKGLFYPHLMFIETALKSYVLEAVLAECKSEKLGDVYRKGLTHYKDSFSSSSNNYKKEFKKRMDLEMKIGSSLIRDYMNGKAFVNHFYNQDKDIPVWAVFESLTLGEFGSFFSCSNKNIRMSVSRQLHLPTRLDDDGFLLSDIIYCLKDLRNAIAHNGIIFDTRFATGKLPKRIRQLVALELGLEEVDFQYIVAYVALTVYLLKKLEESKSKRTTSFINEFEKIHDMLDKLPEDCKAKITGAQKDSIVAAMRNFCKTNT